MTQGERGGDRVGRKREFAAAMEYWGFDYRVLDFPDLGLIFIDLKRMVEEVAEIILKKRLSLLVSFDPREITFGFDHPDHNRAGEVTRVAGMLTSKNGQNCISGQVWGKIAERRRE
jgi:LmbE family N-acetylglucosaminyl deacetylase